MNFEEALHEFFLEAIDAQDLQDVIAEYRESEAESFHYVFRDMNNLHILEPYDLVRICDAVSVEMLQPEDLTLIAETLTRSELFEWEDELISEVCTFWLEPDQASPLTRENAKLFRQWLKGEVPVPA
jgi:hypothetical protein